MPTKKHRKGFRVVESCFTGEEAVTWFLRTLRKNENFGCNVSWEQTQLLLEKFFLAGVFTTCGEDMGKFKPNSTLYKLSNRGPLKTIQLPVTGTFRQQTPQMIVANRKETEMNKAEKAEKVRDELLDRKDTWKEVVYSRLQQLLDGVDLTVLLPSYEVNGYHIVENASITHYYTLAEELEHSNLKSWLTGAMKTLADGKAAATKFTDHMATYTSFQKDIFTEIVNHFKGQPPLIPPELSKAILGAFEYLMHNESSLNCSCQGEKSFLINSKSTEDLILNMSIWPTSNWNPFLAQDAEKYSTNKDGGSLHPQGEEQNWQEHVSKPEVVTPYSASKDRHDMTPDNMRTPVVKDNTLNQRLYEDQNDLPMKKSLNPFKSETGDWIKCDEASTGGDFWESMLPRNCCFETEFLTEVPVTRVIPRPDKKRLSDHPITPIQQIFSPREVVLSSSFSDSPLKPKRKSSGKANMLDAPDTPLLGLDTYPHTASELTPAEIVYERSKPLSLQTSLVQPIEAKNEDMNLEGYSMFSPRPNESLVKKQKRKSHKSRLTEIFALAATPLAKLKSYSVLEVTSHSESIDNNSDETASLLNLAHINDESGGYVNFKEQDSFYPTPMRKLDANTKSDMDTKALNVDLALESVMKLMVCSLETPPPVTKVPHSTPSSNLESSSFFKLEVSKIATTPDKFGNFEGSPELPSDCLNQGGAENKMCTSLENPAISPRDTEEWANLRFDSIVSETTSTDENHCSVDILHHLLLTLPPANRARLSLLLTFMNHLIYKEDFKLHPILSNVSMVINSFKTCILSYNENEDVIVRNPTLPHDIVKFCLEHKDTLFILPSDLVEEVQQNLSEAQQLRNLQFPSSHNLRQLKVIQETPAYCERVTKQEFEKQRLRDSELALFELLEQIAEDFSMPNKEKKQRLKAFSDAYPHLYKMRFPTEEAEMKVLRPVSKSKGLLTRIKTLRF
ncbi:hypothetical protein B566_EDAN007842 [Ephemera danica]|nr:hypothetical protein B566_EDAN007842 [Ephemera danica]